MSATCEACGGAGYAPVTAQTRGWPWENVCPACAGTGRNAADLGERGDLPAPVVGYRAWAYDHGELRALSALVPWEPGINTARCLQWSRQDVLGTGAPDIVREHPGGCPTPGCHCGLYAYHDPDGGPRYDTQGLPIVRGAIVAWGNMQSHPDGFRAQHAEIIALAREHGDLWACDKLMQAAGRYRVPVVPAGQLEALAREHGEPMPLHRRPAPRATPDLLGLAPTGMQLPPPPSMWSQQMAMHGHARLRHTTLPSRPARNWWWALAYLPLIAAAYLAGLQLEQLGTLGEVATILVGFALGYVVGGWVYRRVIGRS